MTCYWSPFFCYLLKTTKKLNYNTYTNKSIINDINMSNRHNNRHHNGRNQDNINGETHNRPYHNRNNDDNNNNRKPYVNNNNQRHNNNNNPRYNNNNNRNNNNPRYNNNNGPRNNTFNNDITNSIDINTKKSLIEYIDITINLSNFKYKLIEFEYDLMLIKDKPYMLSPNYMGIMGLLVFAKIDGKFLSVIIDKKQLTYNLGKIDYNTIKIIPITFRGDESLYDGTIIDGVLMFDDHSGIKKFVVNDVYTLRGKNLVDDRLFNKMINIAVYLETIKHNIIENDVVFIVNKLYKLDQIDDLINNIMPGLKYSKSLSGVAFYPELSGSKLLYLYSNNNVKDNIPVNIPKIDDTPIAKNEYEIIDVKNNVSNDDTDTLTFKVKKTEIVDVYSIYLGEMLPNNYFKYVKIGRAYIPTIESSVFCSEAFTNSGKIELLMDCKYDKSKNGWIPISINNNKKRPDLNEKLAKFIN